MRCLKLIRAYSISLNSSNVGKYKFSCFSSRATTAAKCAKKRDARAKLLLCLTNYKPIAFLPFSLLSPSLLRKLANILPQRARESTLIVVIIDT